VIKIRYADLPGGSHVRAVARGKNTVIYLLPGLSEEQRRAALRRLKSSARMGQGPPLPAVGLARAVLADRMLTTVRNLASAVRVHPAVFVPLIAMFVVFAAGALFVLSSVSTKVRWPEAAAPPTLVVSPAVPAPGPAHSSRPQGPSQPGVVPGSPPPSQSGTPTPKQTGGGRPSPDPAPRPRPGPAPTCTDHSSGRSWWPDPDLESRDGGLRGGIFAAALWSVEPSECPGWQGHSLGRHSHERGSWE
jgi:hypothetical protein